MEKRKFRIGELATHLNVERFVIRFWEKEFALKTTRSTGGQRFYSESDLKTFTIIKELLYQKGFTIAGARKYICDLPKTTLKDTTSAPMQSSTIRDSSYEKTYTAIINQLISLKKQLVQLQELLKK